MSIFINYARKDLREVEVLRRDLEQSDNSVWTDSQLTGGQSWWDVILDQIRECDLFVFALSPASLNSRVCTIELEYALGLDRPLLPVMIRDVPLTLAPPAIASRQIVDYRVRTDRAAAALAAAVASLRAAPPLPDPLPRPPQPPWQTERSAEADSRPAGPATKLGEATSTAGPTTDVPGTKAAQATPTPGATSDMPLNPATKTRIAHSEPTPWGLDPAALAIMAWTTAVRDRRDAGDATVLDVVLGSLAWAAASLSGTSPAPDPAAQALFWTLRSDRAELQALVTAALDRMGVGSPSPTADPPTATDLEPWSSVLVASGAIARSTTGAELIQQRHLIAAALTSIRLPNELTAMLGADNGELAMRLREGIGRSWPSESQEVWTSVLGLDRLATRFASDFVPWSERRHAGQPAVPLPDQLQLDAYVTMLATTIVRKTTAMPLSIGLFGEWGSGKSYFMRLLRQKVDILRKGSHAGTGPYYEHVVQITFNAWNYADTNLWASLAAEFFDQLGKPDPDLDYDAARRQEIKDALAKQSQVRQELVSLREAAEQRTKTARDQYVTAVVEREQKSRRFGIELIKAMADDRDIRSDLQGLAKQLGFGEQETEKTLRLAEDVRGMADDLSATRRVLASRSLVVPFVLLLIALAVTGAALLIPEGTWAKIAGTTAVTSIIAFIGSLGLVVGKSRQLVTQLRDVADRADQARLRVLAGGDVAVLAEDLHRAEAEEAIAQARLEELDATISRLDRQLDELEPGRRLYQFIAERAASVEYRSQLGVVSSVRRDFEELVALMDDWRHTTEPTSEGQRRPLDRIVLYVDDLDRCEPDQVVQVLQAVHLLLAMDLFVVVVGVDPRWLLRALRRRYRGILGAAAVEADDRSLGFAASTPQNYLEKIFQIPFVLPGMSADGFGRLMRSLASPESTESPSQRRADSDGAAPEQDGRAAGGAARDRTSQAVDGRPGSAESAAAGASHQPAPVRPEAHSEVAAAMAAGDPLTSGTVAEIVSTPVTERELVLLSRLAPLVRTPRAATRLFNIYGILRSATDLTPGRQFLGNPHQPGDYQAVAQLLGVLSAAPHLLGPVLWGQPAEGEPDDLGLCRATNLTSWSAFVDSLEPRQTDPVESSGTVHPGSQAAVAGSSPAAAEPPKPAGTLWSNAVAAELAAGDIEDWRDVVAELQALRDIVKLDEITPYRVWGPQIARFSFLLSPFAVDSAVAV